MFLPLSRNTEKHRLHVWTPCAEVLAERAKIPPAGASTTIPPSNNRVILKDELLQIHEQITQRWQNCLLNEAAGQMARDYLAKRGVFG